MHTLVEILAQIEYSILNMNNNRKALKSLESLKVDDCFTITIKRGSSRFTRWLHATHGVAFILGTNSLQTQPEEGNVVQVTVRDTITRFNWMKVISDAIMDGSIEKVVVN